MSFEIVLGLIIIGVLFFVYFIPSFVAHNKRNAQAIFVLNLLLGWTIICWIGALIWAMVEKKEKKK